MVKIRLRPVGRKGQRSYWIVAIDSKEPRDSGNFLEKLGFYNPRTKEVKLDKDNIKKRLSWGAQPTDKTVKSLLKKYL